MAGQRWAWGLLAVVGAGCVGPAHSDAPCEAPIDGWLDRDGDGFGDATAAPAEVCPGAAYYADNPGDCDDARADVNPDAAEACNGIDDDCDDAVDDDLDETVYFADLDGDGFGSQATLSVCGDPGPGWVGNDDDCDDALPDVNPDGAEVCDDGIDDDCDGLADDDDPTTDAATMTQWFRDDDGDGHGAPGFALRRCAGLPGYADADDDCDDTRPEVSPSAAEIPADHVDEDCDGLEGCWDDDDGDGARAATFTEGVDLTCSEPGHLTDAAPTDCDDMDPSINVDIDWLVDTDGDGYGSGAPVVTQCTDPGGGLASGLDGEDCDESDPGVHPDAADVCGDGVDTDCDGNDGCAPQCGLAQASYTASLTFVDHQQATTMGLAWNGASFWSVSGGAVGGMRMSEYDAAGGFLADWATQPDFRSIFTLGDGSADLYARAYNGQAVLHWNGNAFVNAVNLTGINLGTQGVVVWDDFYGQYVATTDVPAQIPLFDPTGVRTQTVTLSGFVGAESQYPQGRSLAMASGCMLTYFNRTLSTWDPSGVRVDTAQLLGAGTSFDSYFSLSYAQGRVFVVDVAGGTWRGYDVGL